MRRNRIEAPCAGAVGLLVLSACAAQEHDQEGPEVIVVASTAEVPPVATAREEPTTPAEPGMLDWLPNCRLTTHEGREVRFYDDLIRGRIVLINFMYTKCDGI